LDGLLAYWKRQLAGAPTILDLPADRPRPAVFSHRGAVEAFEVPPDTAVRLRKLQEQEGVTLFVLLLTAFGGLLRRYSGQDDLLVGTPVASRSRAELEELIGLFVNTLVLRLEMSGDPSFRQLLHRVRETVFGAQEHQDLLFERLISALDLDRSPGRNPLFQVVFTLDNTPAGGAEAAQGLAMTPVSLPARTAKFDLQLTVREAGPRLVGFFEYATDLFEAASIRRMAGHLLTLLESISQTPDRAVGDLPMLGAAERQEILRWSQPSGDPGPLFCLHEAFAVQAAKAPDRIAAVCEGRELTYGELHLRSDRLARRLQDLGAGPETRVGIYMERSLDLVVALLGVLKAGGAYVPLDTAYPPERLIYMLEDSAAELVLTQSRLAPALEGATARILPVDALEGKAQASALPPVSRAVPENAAYVIYTSGSTGRPKGVVVPHANVARLFNTTQGWFRFGERDVWTLFHSHAFDFSVWELWGALLYGGRLVVVPYLTSRSPELFARLLLQERVTVLNQTPSAFRALTLAVEAAEAPRPRDLRWVIFGGEALELRSLEPWWDLLGDRSPVLVNMYGITETTVHVTYRPLRRQDLGAGSMVGRSLPDLELYVLDPASRDLVPVGVPGELHVGGAGLARGYLDRPSLTAERFVPDPFGGRPGARLYRSGDLARWRPQGDLEYLGRIDDQVKVRGFRIELGEIEAALRRQPGVRDAFVMLREDAPGDRRLAAYVVAAGEPTPHDALRASLSRELPDYMVPAAFVSLDALPLTPHGKIDRRALPAPQATAPAQRDYVAPRNELEEALAAVWAETLGVGRVGVHDSFFALGGDSIRSLKVIAAARERGLRFPVHLLFQFPTVAELAAAIAAAAPAEEAPRGAVTEPFSLLTPADREKLPPGLEDAYPMASLQTGMLYHRDETPDRLLFHNVNSYHLRMRFDEAAFRLAVERVVRRHAVLRTSFDLARFSEPMQLVHREVVSPLAVEDLRHLPAGAQEETLARYWDEERHRPFDLASAPQIRLRIHRRADDSFQFTLTENHAILDGWSLHTIYSEVLGGYFALIDGSAPPQWPVLRTTYRDFVALEREALASPASREFWERQLAGCTVLKIPRWPLPAGSAEPPGFRRLNVSIPGDVLALLRRRAEDWSVPLKTLFLSAHLAVLSYVSGEDDVLTALSANGRPETVDAERVCGLFLNALPLRLRLVRERWPDLVRRVHQAELAMMPHRRYPVAAIQERRGREALFETAFIYLNFHVMGDVVRAGGVELLGTGAMVEETNFALSATFQHGLGDESGVHLSLDCGEPEIADGQLQTIAGYYLALLRSLASEPGAWLDAVLPLSAPQRQALTEEWNDTRAPLPLWLPHRRIEEQAGRRPAQAAVVGEEETLSYGELILRARSLAARLRASGVGPEDAVGLLSERSPALIVGVLGILMAGGAYLPLDPDLPPGRIAFLVEDARPRLVLAQERLAGGLPPSLPVILLEGLETGGGAALDAPEILAEQLAYVIYTSGSTGRPKGTGVTHRSLANDILWRQERGFVLEDDRVFFKTTISFDISLWEILGPLVAGATIVVARDGGQGDPAYLARLIAERRVTMMQAPPSFLRVFLDDTEERDLSSLRCLICGGERLPADLRERVFARLDVQLNDHYGPTEATIEALGERCLPGADRCTIGRPMRNVRAYVLDRWMRPVPAATPGELYLGGEGVARGYLGRPDLTAERFVPDPFTAGSRLYRTGDLVSQLPDGRVEFLGRTDHQVKIRGFRVEPGEIESVLREHPGVSRAAVVVVQGGSSPRLAAYWVAAPGEETGPRDLQAFLAQRMPAYMVPSLLTKLDELPLLPSGKLDLQALPAPADSLAESGGGVPPRNPVEMQLVHIWEEILGRHSVGVTDNFFDLGGTSLLAIRLTALLRERFQQEVPLATLLKAGTIERMAEILRGGMAPPPASLIVPMQPRGEKRPLYCVAPGHGSILCYVPLARHMGVDRPFLGLQWPDLQAGGDPYLSVEDIAGRYLAELRERQPRGPYLLAGWSFGGLVAFEMACQLAEREEEVGKLALIDTHTPEIDAEMFEMDLELMKAYLLMEHAKDIAGMSADDLPISPHDLVGLSFEEQFALLMDKLRLRERLSRELRPEMVGRYLAVRIARVTAIRNYRPRTFPGGMTLLRSQEVYTDASLPEVREILEAAARNLTYGWDRFTGGPVDVRWIPGDHESIVAEPYVRTLAAELGSCLDE
jgi:amino acid adenylation domain-containing protein